MTCSCGQLAPKRKAEVGAGQGRQFFPNSPCRQFSSLPSSPSHRRTGRRKAGGSSDIYLGEKHALQRHWRGTDLHTLTIIINILGWARPVHPSWVCRSECNASNLSVRQPVCLPERRGMRNPKEGWRCQVWSTPESGILLNGNFSAFQHCLSQDQMNCLFNTVFWKLHTWCTQHSVGIEFNSGEN